MFRQNAYLNAGTAPSAREGIHPLRNAYMFDPLKLPDIIALALQVRGSSEIRAAQ